jgi:hypothetical protein
MIVTLVTPHVHAAIAVAYLLAPSVRNTASTPDMGQLRLDQLQLHYNYVTFTQLKLQLLPNYWCSITITITKPTIKNTITITLSLYY